MIREIGAYYMGFDTAPDAADSVKLYWWEGYRNEEDARALLKSGKAPYVYNFGDLLSAVVVSLLSRKRVTYSVGPGKFIAIGTVFFALADNDTVWGAGLLKAEHLEFARRAKNVRYLAVRGPKTRQMLRSIGLECPEVYGDPATFLPQLVANDIEPRYEIGVVPHWTQTDEFKRNLRDPRILVIDVRQKFDEVIRQILACRTVLSTSLHGVIISECYKIPSLLVVYREPIRGDLHKFDDYFQATGRDTHYRKTDSFDDLPKLVEHAFKTPAPTFNTQKLLQAFPYRDSRAPLGPPRLRWSQLSWKDFSCFYPKQV